MPRSPTPRPRDLLPQPDRDVHSLPVDVLRVRVYRAYVRCFVCVRAVIGGILPIRFFHQLLIHMPKLFIMHAAQRHLSETNT